MFQTGNNPDPSLTSGFERSDIELAIIAAYMATEYLVTAVPPFVLWVGSQCRELSALYKKYRVDCCAFITACNPFSKQLDPAVNVDRQAALTREIEGRGLSFTAGVGQHPSNNWPGEPNFLVLGLSQDLLSAGRPTHLDPIRRAR